MQQGHRSPVKVIKDIANLIDLVKNVKTLNYKEFKFYKFKAPLKRSLDQVISESKWMKKDEKAQGEGEGSKLGNRIINERDEALKKLKEEFIEACIVLLKSGYKVEEGVFKLADLTDEQIQKIKDEATKKVEATQVVQVPKVPTKEEKETIDEKINKRLLDCLTIVNNFRNQLNLAQLMYLKVQGNQHHEVEIDVKYSDSLMEIEARLANQLLIAAGGLKLKKSDRVKYMEGFLDKEIQKLALQKIADFAQQHKTDPKFKAQIKLANTDADNLPDKARSMWACNDAQAVAYHLSFGEQNVVQEQEEIHKRVKALDPFEATFFVLCQKLVPQKQQAVGHSVKLHL